MGISIATRPATTWPIWWNASSKKAFTARDSIEPDEYYGEVVPCIMEILAALHKLNGTAAIPPPDVVAGWKATFLAARDKAFEGAIDANDTRRAAISKAFDKLRRLSRNVHEG